MTKMLAYHNDTHIKEKYLARVRAHALADEIIKGQYWENGKGCAVGCTIHGRDHKRYEAVLGIPEWLARVEDRLFEGMPLDESKLWPERFLAAIKPGVDLDKIKASFLIFVLESALEKFDHEKFPDVKDAIETVIKLYQDGETEINKFFHASAAAEEAIAAARAAEEASAAWAASAAWVAAEATWEVAAIARAVEAAAWAGEQTAAREDKKEYKKFSDKLIELIEGLELEK